MQGVRSSVRVKEGGRGGGGGWLSHRTRFFRTMGSGGSGLFSMTRQAWRTMPSKSHRFPCIRSKRSLTFARLAHMSRACFKTTSRTSCMVCPLISHGALGETCRALPMTPRMRLSAIPFVTCHTPSGRTRGTRTRGLHARPTPLALTTQKKKKN